MVPVTPEDAHLAWRQHKAVEAAAFRKKYPRSRRLNANHFCSLSVTGIWGPFKLMPCAKDWLDAYCPGWGLLHTSGTGSYIGFAEPYHRAWFMVAASMMSYREQWRWRQDASVREDREEQAMKMAHFRAVYPVKHRLRRADRYRIWHMRSYHPLLLDEVREWLEENAPGWSQFPKTRFIGFADPDHAVCFKMVWGGVQ